MELLVVIAIVGILAAIAVPRFFESTYSANGAKLKADLRTIDSAIAIAQANGWTVAVSTADISTLTGAANQQFVDALGGTVPTPPTGQWKTQLHSTAQSAIGTSTYGINANGRAYCVATGATACRNDLSWL